jgi:hypothetical protein
MNLQIKNHKKSHELRLITPQTQQKNPEQIYLKFLTPTTPSVEKTVNLCKFKQVYKPRNINIFLVSVDHNGIAVHLTRSDSDGF